MIIIDMLAMSTVINEHVCNTIHGALSAKIVFVKCIYANVPHD